MTKTFIIGKLGKPHGLQGYAYVHLNDYLKTYEFKDIGVQMNNQSFTIQEIKSHLKNRHLIKFYKINTIEDIEKKRDNYLHVSFNTMMKMNHRLPWPELLLGERIKNNENLEIFVSSYTVYSSNTLLEITSTSSKSYMIPYVSQNFSFDGKYLYLKENLTFY